MSSKGPDSHASLIANLKETLTRLQREVETAAISASARRVLEIEIRSVVLGLADMLAELDPIRQPTAIFDPGNPKIVGRFISLALVAQPRQALASVPRFYGSGVYAIYYTGGFPLYASLSRKETPIYVGQAAPAIPNARTPSEQGDRLSRRLEDHRKNISRATSTLSVDDFEFRVLVVQSGWESAAEDYLIHLFKPIWNSEQNLVYGLGKHGDSAETRSNRRSPWDTLHPGRKWAAATKEYAKTEEKIKEEVRMHFSVHPPINAIDDLLSTFVEDLRQI